VSCATPNAGGGDVFSGLNKQVRAAIIGGQGQNVRLTSSNIQVVADTFAFDVTVQNLIPQSLGTTDGVTLDPAGVRVFFHAGPTSTGSGTVTVANPDGTGTFTGSSQFFFQYNTLLVQNAVTPTKRWKLKFTPDVATFTFTVFVSAAVRYPNGYVDGVPYVITLNPGETRELTGTVRSFTGQELSSKTVTWSTDNPTNASVTGTQVTAGPSNGFATLTAASGERPAIYPTSISVCQATVVADGANVPSAIASTDCFSSYRGPDGRPTTSYYGDLYRVTLTAGQTITVTLDSGDNLDTYLKLANPGFGTVVAANDDDDEGILGLGSRIVYTAAESGVFVIEASTYSGLDTGAYTLEVTIS
jgi:hypothetical protein